jgi:hypothetical protein
VEVPLLALLEALQLVLLSDQQNLHQQSFLTQRWYLHPEVEVHL